MIEIEQHSRRTKVVKSFEGQALTREGALKVAAEEVDVLRLVYDRHCSQAILDFIKAANGQRNPTQQLSIMLDISSWTQGMISGLAQPRALAFGEKITLSPEGGKGALQVRTDNWDHLFVQDAKVFLGPGYVSARVTSVQANLAELEVTQGGDVYSEMDVVIPETRKERQPVTAEELKDFLHEGVDYLIVPGQWTTATIAEYRGALVHEAGDAAPWLLAKVDSGEVCERLPELIQAVDGVLISRREMAYTVNPATMPMITKEIIQLCNDQAKVVVTASEMLASMRRNVTPTRAEVSDIANAVLDGTDAVVLSEEVANGRYGSEAVATIDRIIRDIEDYAHVAPNWIKHAPRVTNEMDAVAYEAYRTAERLNAKALVCITKGGNTALKLASFRPPVPIIAVTFTQPVVRRLSIVRGVDSLLLEVNPNLDEVLPVVNDRLVRSSWLKPGDRIIFVSITLSSVGLESSNLFNVQTLT